MNISQDLNADNQDIILKSMVHQTNANGINFDIILLIEGATISGTVVSDREYLIQLADEAINAFTKGLPKSETTYIQNPHHINANIQIIENENSMSHYGELPEFMHLKNVVVEDLSGNSPKSRSSYWRIKISSVAAWKLV